MSHSKISDSEHSMGTQHTGRIKSVVFALLILLFFFAGAEVILRTTHIFGARPAYTLPDSLLGWRFCPGSQYWSFEENDHPITGTINSYGWRDDEWSLAKSPGTARIAVLGDSYIAALQVEPESTFASLLERRWNRDHDLKIEVMNFGRPGFTQTEELIVLKREVTRFQPDIVVLFFVPANDIRDVRRVTATDPTRPFYHVSDTGELLLDAGFTESREFRFRSRVNRLARRSALVGLVMERYAASRLEKRADALRRAGPDDTLIAGTLSLATANPDTALLRSYSLNKVLIRAIADVCRAEDIELMLVAIQTRAYDPNVERRLTSRDPTFRPEYFHDDMRQYADALGLDYIGLETAFRQAYEAKQARLSWMHWNYRGHEVVAEVLGRKLEFILGSELTN